MAIKLCAGVTLNLCEKFTEAELQLDGITESTQAVKMSEIRPGNQNLAGSNIDSAGGRAAGV